MLITAILLFILSICAAIGWFSVSSRDVWRMFVAFVVPALLIIVPLRYAQNISVDGFDQYAGGRAIAIRSQNYPLPGLYEKSHEITVDDDDFGSWYDEIDHNAAKYDGYAITLTGFVSRDSTLNANQFRVSRQLMSCCILDMSPFGLVAENQILAKFKIMNGCVFVHAFLEAILAFLDISILELCCTLYQCKQLKLQLDIFIAHK